MPKGKQIWEITITEGSENRVCWNRYHGQAASIEMAAEKARALAAEEGCEKPTVGDAKVIAITDF